MHNNELLPCRAVLEKRMALLNEAQRSAVCYAEKPLLVLAGPGAGKTTVLNLRVRFLVEKRKIPPEQILVITFTKEAAISMQRRFLEQVNDTCPVNFGTFHSVFYHILLKNRNKPPEIMRENQKKNLIRSILRRKEYKEVLPGDCEELTALFWHAISVVKNTGNIKSAGKLLGIREEKKFLHLFDTYETERKQKNLMDFDDMIYECAQLLERDPNVKTYWQKRFSHVLIDEFQDINPLQYKVVKLLAPPPNPLFVVGDDDQSIYGFRGSDPECMRIFMNDYHAEQVLLNVNYRSSNEIVDASLKVIGQNENRFRKDLISGVERAVADNLDTDLSEGVQLCSFPSRDEQYEYLRKEILRYSNSSDKSMAVLFRTNLCLRIFAAGLRRSGIRYEAGEERENIYTHFIVRDIFAYLTLSEGEIDRECFLRITNRPGRYPEREKLYNLLRDNRNCSQLQNMLQSDQKFQCQWQPGERSALELLLKQLSFMKNMSPSLRVQYICRVIGYEKYLDSLLTVKREGEWQREEWFSVLDWIKTESVKYHSVREWFEFVQKDSVKDKNSHDGKGRSRIHLMTVHRAKGLEFDWVFIPDCNEGIYPFGSMPEKNRVEEECRLFYVGMTRAKESLELLYLTGTKDRPRLPSRFLNPILRVYSSTSSSNSQLSRYSSNASATFSYSSSSSR